MTGVCTVMGTGEKGRGIENWAESISPTFRKNVFNRTSLPTKVIFKTVQRRIARMFPPYYIAEKYRKTLPFLRVRGLSPYPT